MLDLQLEGCLDGIMWLASLAEVYARYKEPIPAGSPNLFSPSNPEFLRILLRDEEYPKTACGTGDDRINWQ